MRTLILLFIASGCTARTEIVVGVATDLRARAQMDGARILASRQGVTLVDKSWDLTETTPKDGDVLPGSFGLYSADGSEVAVDLSVKGYKGGNLVADRESHFTMKSGKTLFVRMSLTGECSPGVGPACKADESCVEGTCQPLAFDAGLLPDYRDELVTKTECDGPLQYIVSSTGAPMDKLGTTCATGTCHEGVCWKQ